jgi:hypothetical protein
VHAVFPRSVRRTLRGKACARVCSSGRSYSHHMCVFLLGVSGGRSEQNLHGAHASLSTVYRNARVLRALRRYVLQTSSRSVQGLPVGKQHESTSRITVISEMTLFYQSICGVFLPATPGHSEKTVSNKNAGFLPVKLESDHQHHSHHQHHPQSPHHSHHPHHPHRPHHAHHPVPKKQQSSNTAQITHTTHTTR